MSKPVQPRVTARLGMHVEITLDKQKQIYDIDTARQLRDELTMVLNQLDAQQEIETDQMSLPLQQSDSDQQDDDVAPLVEAVAAGQGA